MPIDYLVSKDGRKIEAFPKGVLTINETFDYFGRIIKDTKIKQNAVEIVHFRHVSDFRISYLEGERITTYYQQAKSLQHIKATIFVCETALAYGVGRMLQALHEVANPKHVVSVVRTEGELETTIKGLVPDPV